jgi:hypothetical protein
MPHDLKDFLVNRQWKQDKPEDTPVVKQARHTKMRNTIKRAVDRLGDIWKR